MVALHVRSRAPRVRTSPALEVLVASGSPKKAGASTGLFSCELFVVHAKAQSAGRVSCCLVIAWTDPSSNNRLHTVATIVVVTTKSLSRLNLFVVTINQVVFFSLACKRLTSLQLNVAYSFAGVLMMSNYVFN